MDYLDLTLPTAEENLALDEALLLEAETEGASEILRFWELPHYAVILGASNRLALEVNEEHCRADGVPICRRCSGGGAVLLGPGCLSFSLVLSSERPHLNDITHSYRFIMERVRQALLPLHAGVELAGSSDLAVGNFKFSGNSQRRLRRFILHHGTILYAFDLARIGRYLRHPEREPEYRRRRGHAEFVVNLGHSTEILKAQLRSSWGADRLRAAWPEASVRQLVAEKYGQSAWTRRR